MLCLKGGPCVENTRGSLGWLQTNLGSFSSLATYEDLTDMNADFSSVSDSARQNPAQAPNPSWQPFTGRKYLLPWGKASDFNVFSQIDAVAGLSPKQLATYTLASDVLRDVDKAGKVFSSLSSHNLGDFMDAFNAAAKQVPTSPPYSRGWNKTV